MKKNLTWLIIFFLGINTTFGASGQELYSFTHSGTADVLNITLDSENNLYVLEQDKISKLVHIDIYEKFIQNTHSGAVINNAITSSGGITISELKTFLKSYEFLWILKLLFIFLLSIFVPILLFILWIWGGIVIIKKNKWEY